MYPLIFYVKTLPPDVGGCANGPTSDDIKKVIRYEPDTGHFYRLQAISPRSSIGDRADIDKGGGYRSVRCLGSRYSAHRLAWVIFYGKWPDGEIDHINHDPSDNRIVNLRDVSKSINQQNLSGPQKNNKAGFLGVWKNKKRWGSRIRSEGKDIFLGNFDTPQQAHEAYLVAKRDMHPGGTL